MFAPSRHGSSVSRECLAGLTTFAAMAYILVVNPAMLALTGMDHAALITATALAAAAGSILMGLLTNYPIALAPGMGLNAFFAFTICGQLQVPWQGALAMVFWTGLLFLALSLTRFREQVVQAIPPSLKIGIQAGIGLFIVVIGLKNIGLFANPAAEFPALRFNPISTLAPMPVALTLLGCALAVVMMKKRIPAALLLAMLAATAIGLLLSSGGKPITSLPESLVALPPSPAPLWFQLDWWYPFRHWETIWLAALSLFFVDLFDSIGTLIGVSDQADLNDRRGNLPKMRQALAADAAATTLGALFGTSTTTAYIESATGVEAGGRTGLTPIIVAACFLLALFFHPLVAAIPAAAVAPALLIVGGLMMKSLDRLKASDWQGLAAAITVVVLIPLNFQIAEGIASGCIVYTVLMIASGQWRKIHWLMALLSALFVLWFAL